MSRTLLAPIPVHGFLVPSKPSRVGHFERWLASLLAARERRAKEAALRHLEGHIPHASDADRARIQALADGLRDSLR